MEVKKNIVIAGCGFAGISALRYFIRHGRRLRKEYNIVLLDRRKHFEFLPMLPDIIGGWADPAHLRTDIGALAEKIGADLLEGSIDGINIDEKTVDISGIKVNYAYLIISNGMKVNYYGREDLDKSCYKVYSVDDALGVRKVILERTEKSGKINIVVAGGGYTGVEVATNVRYMLKKRNISGEIYIVESAPDILGVLPEWTRERIRKELQRLKINILTGEAMKEYDGKRAVLKSGKEIDDAVCIWTAGVKPWDFIDRLKFTGERGRVTVDEYLSFPGGAEKGVFMAGDVCSFKGRRDKSPIRMAVMFSMGQGRVAAVNVMRSIHGRPFKKYRPVDLGYLVPMAHGRAYGTVMGMKITGRAGYFLHYFMCIYRAGFKNGKGILKDLLFREF